MSAPTDEELSELAAKTIYGVSQIRDAFGLLGTRDLVLESVKLANAMGWPLSHAAAWMHDAKVRGLQLGAAAE